VLFICPAKSVPQSSPDIRVTQASSISVSPKVVKETEKALRALWQNKLEEAQQSLMRALATDPHFPDGNYLMGLLLLRRKESGNAVAYLQKSLELSPNYAAALLALGEAQYLEHDYTNAVASLEKFLEQEPRSPEAPTTQKYLTATRTFLQQKAAEETDSGLPPLPELPLTTEVSWAPPDVDAEKLDLGSFSHLSTQRGDAVRQQTGAGTCAERGPLHRDREHRALRAQPDGFEDFA
jgi:tetratricopeptide (TPR) repeat protein